MARPKVEENRKRYTIRLMSNELAKIDDLADRAGLTTSEYIRRCALGKRMHSKVNIKAMAELNRLGGLQKLCITHFPEDRGHLHEVIEEILKTLKSLRELGA
jgi:hypothetical protein